MTPTLDRRGFLGALLGLAAAPVLAKLSPILMPEMPLAEALAAPPPLIMPTIEGRGHVTDLNVAAGPECTTVRVLRTAVPPHYHYPRAEDLPYMLLQINTHPHHYAHWRAGFGNEIEFDPAHPITVVFPLGAHGNMIWLNDLGDTWVREFYADGTTRDYLARHGRSAP